MNEDISEKTVVILLVLTILISVAGTLVVLEEAQKIKIAESSFENSASEESSPAVGMIKVNIQRPPAELQGGEG